jgi:hypothetical protein
VSSPVCVAVIVQVPTETGWSEAPATRQTSGVADVMVTGRPESDVAAGVAVPVMSRSGGCGNVITCGALATWNDRVTGTAAAYVASPAWAAVTVQVPADTSVTVVPATVQTPWVDDVNVTASPEPAVAVSVRVPAVTRTSVGCANVIVCEVEVTANVRDTGVAAS